MKDEEARPDLHATSPSSRLEISSASGVRLPGFLQDRIDGRPTKRQNRLNAARTKAALDAKRIREPDWRPGRPSGISPELLARIVEMRKTMTLAGIAAQLNLEGVATSQGGREWWASSVRAILRQDADA